MRDTEVHICAQRLGEVIWDALNRLNCVDRDDSFWWNTNRRPTVSKIFDYARRLVYNHPADEDALWVLALSDSFYGSNEFGQDWWARLWRLGRLDIRWPLWAGLWNEMMLGFGPPAMVTFLRGIDCPPEARQVLEEIFGAEDIRLREWAHDVIGACYP